MNHAGEALPPRVFISYSHVPTEHADRVRGIAQRLASDGADVEMDIWSVREGHDLNAFMERMATDGTVGKVLIFSNRSYAEKADSRSRGVGVEAQILSAEIYGKAEQEKFIPIVCEYDEAGSACLPTFLKGRLYIDFSSGQAEAENYERLLRRIYGKPEHTKPAVGKPPAFIVAGTVPANPMAAKLRSYRDALLAGKTTTRFMLEDFLERFVQLLTEQRIRENSEEPFDETLVRSLETMKPLRDDFLELCDVWLRGPDAQLFVPKTVEVLEQVRALAEWPEGVDTWNDNYGDNFRFLAHELLLSIGAVMLRQREFERLAEFLGTRFVLPDSERRNARTSGSFTLFFEYAEMLWRRNERLKLRRLNLQADLLKQRATTRAVPFVWLQQADLICCVCSLLLHPEDSPWYPHTLLYAREFSPGFEIFQRAESRAFYNRLASIWGNLNPDQFQVRLAKGIEEGRAAKWDFDYRQPNWNGWLNLEKLATKP